MREDKLAQKEIEFEKCLQGSIGAYKDEMSHFLTNYTLCKQDCMKADRNAAQVVEKYKDSKFVDPYLENECLKSCKKLFRKHLLVFTQYYTKEYGFFIEHSKEFI